MKEGRRAMKERLRKSYVLRIAVVCVLSLLLGFLADRAVFSLWSSEGTWIVRVESIGEREPVPLDMPEPQNEDPQGNESLGEWQQVRIPLVVRFLTGDRRGEQEQVVVEQLANSGISLNDGDRYFLGCDTFHDGSVQCYVSDFYRVPWVVGFISLAAGGLVASAGVAGIRALLGLVLSLVALLGWFVPAVHDGASPIPYSIAAVALVTAFTVLLVVRRKHWRPVAFLGAVGGAVTASVIGSVMVWFWKLSGMAGEGGALLASTLPGLSLKGLLLASVIVGSIGAVLDVAVSVTSTVAELSTYDPQITPTRLWQAGLGVGREVLGSMVNTLILAYLGGSLPFVVLIAEAGPTFFGFFNDPSIAEEIVRSLAGTMGLLLTVPITAFLGMWWHRRDQRREQGRPGMRRPFSS